MHNRLPSQPGEYIDRSRPITITFEGRSYRGYAGDTISSLLLANGVKLLGRSFKYHRPRSVLSAANHDVNVMLESADDTNIRADVTSAVDGMRLWAINTVGGLRFDTMQVLNLLARFLPVGFYYKTFFRPRWLFPYWEKLIRRMTGLGKINTNWTAQRRRKRYAHCDVLVVGAGPAGLSAALAAAEQNLQVILVDENPSLGGSLRYQYTDQYALIEQVLASTAIKVYCNAYACGYYADQWVPLMCTDGIIKVRCRAMVVSTGAFEQAGVFHNNDVPGVMLLSAAQRLLLLYAVKPCESCVVLSANRSGYDAALQLHRAGVVVKAIADLSETEPSASILKALAEAGITVYPGFTAYEVMSRQASVRKVRLAPLRDAGQCDLSQLIEIECDGVLMSLGWAPAAALLYQAGTQMRFDDQLGQFLPAQLPRSIYAAGRVNGVFDLDAQIADGRAAGLEAATMLTGNAVDASRPGRETTRQSHPYPIVHHPRGKNFVDFDEDIQVNDLVNAAAEGFDNIELMKRYSTIGMGPSQGKHSNMHGIRILARQLGQSIDSTGSTTARPFYHPVPLSHLAGHRFRPERKTPMHAWHEANYAVFVEAGVWQRPEYYASSESREKAIENEVTAVRNGLGLIDVSTLGKLEAFGRDAAELMDRLFTMRMSNITVGMTRYALMVDEAGTVIDDGVAARLAEDRFYFSTTTSTSDSAYRLIQRLILEWGLEVELVNLSGQLAAMNLAGPRSREMLQPLTDISLDDEIFPYLGARRGRLAGVDVLLLRVGFVGELGYEIHVNAKHALTAWQTLVAAGAAFDLKPFGVGAQRLLRLEKGHIIVGQDTDGLTSPYDAGMTWAVHLKKEFFVGKRALQFLVRRRECSLFGFILPIGYRGPRPEECHLVVDDNEIIGRVTSVAFSPTLNRVIGLALIKNLKLQIGDLVTIKVDSGVRIAAAISSLPFYDPGNTRQQLLDTVAA